MKLARSITAALSWALLGVIVGLETRQQLFRLTYSLLDVLYVTALVLWAICAVVLILIAYFSRGEPS